MTTYSLLALKLLTRRDMSGHQRSALPDLGEVEPEVVLGDPNQTADSVDREGTLGDPPADRAGARLHALGDLLDGQHPGQRPRRRAGPGRTRRRLRRGWRASYRALKVVSYLHMLGQKPTDGHGESPVHRLRAGRHPGRGPRAAAAGEG